MTEAMWQPIVNAIVNSVRSIDIRFAGLSMVPTGSYYEGVKDPSDVDFMLVMTMGSLMLWPTPLAGYTEVALFEELERMKWRLDGCADDCGRLNATQIKNVFLMRVIAAITALGYASLVTAELHGPAVTLQIGGTVSVDLTLAISIVWPGDAEEWSIRPRNGWPNQHLVQDIFQEGCHIVAKKPKGGYVPGNEFFWRFSFSVAEKKLFLQVGYSEATSCSKMVLGIMRAMRKELNLQDHLTSYHLKTIWLYECEAFPHPGNWTYDRFNERCIGFLQRLVNCLGQLNLPHYFMKCFNLLQSPHCFQMAAKVQQYLESRFMPHQNPGYILQYSTGIPSYPTWNSGISGGGYPTILCGLA